MRHFARYPGDEELAARILQHLHERDVMLPTGGRLTVRRFQQLGFLLGFDEGMETLHYLLETAFCDGANGAELSLSFLHGVENSQPFETNPIFAVLHEVCYTQQAASRWSAHRIRREAAELLARDESWPMLYDPAHLAANPIPAAAAIYAEDMYVPRTHSEPTAAAIRGMKVWLTSEFEHNGLRTDGERVFGRLLDLARDRV